MIIKLRPIFIFSILLFVVTACATTEAQPEETIGLDRSTWPTAPAADGASLPTPTPFPTLDPALVEAAKAKAEAQKQGFQNPANQSLAEQETLPTPTPEVVAAEQPTDVGTASVETEANESPSSDDVSAEAVAESDLENESTDTGNEAIEVAAEPQREEQQAMVATFGLNLRSGPGLTFDIVRQMRQGTRLTILGKDEASTWVTVQTADGVAGWVNGKYLIMGDTSEIPIVAGVNISVRTVNSAAPEASGTSEETLLIQPQPGGDIFLINRDGTNLKRLTAGLDPILSPDGSTVAFTRWGGGEQGELWVANTDGSGERLILGGMRKAKSPSWSPDSQRIALNFQDGGRINVERKCRPVSEGPPDINFWIAFDIALEFDAQGRPTKLCWSVPPDPHWKLRIINLDPQSTADLPAGQYAFAPTWDPANSNRVVSVNNTGLVWTDVADGRAYTLTSDPSDRGPTFSQNGQYIAVTYYQHDHWEVHRLNADGSGRVRLTKTPFHLTVTGDKRQWNNASPVFSPDSTEIAFLTDRTGRWEVWVMGIDGSNQRPAFSEAVNDQFSIRYEGNDARMLGWSR